MMARFGSRFGAARGTHRARDVARVARRTTVVARIAHALRRLGPIGWCAGAVIGLAATGAPLVRSHLNADNATLQRNVEELRAQAQRERTHAGIHAGLDPVSALASQLPAADVSRAFVKDVQDLADASSVDIERSEYRLEPLLGRRAVRLRISLPARGTYPALRHWLQALLAKYPSSSLDDLTLRRAAEGAGELDALIALSFTTSSAP
jgi:hypothetical protein